MLRLDMYRAVYLCKTNSFGPLCSVARGWLPQLQHLMMQRCMTPIQVLRTLNPLLPLPSMTYVSTHGACGLTIEVSSDIPVAAQALALRQVAARLATPNQPVGHLVLNRAPGWPLQLSLSLQQITDALKPLGAQLDVLQLQGLALEDVDWTLLSGALPRVSRFGLNTCSMTDASMATLPLQMPSMNFLLHAGCTGLTEDGWLQLAAGCPHALELVGNHAPPGMAGDLEQRCQKVQEEKYGKHTLTWSRHEGMVDV